MAANIQYCFQRSVTKIVQWFSALKKKLDQRVELFGSQHVAFGIFGALNYPAYYFIWRHYASQSYESFWLRLIATILSVFLIFKKYWPDRIKSWFSFYWLGTLCFCLPFFFFFMLLKNNGASVWLMSTNTILFWLVLMVDGISYVLVFLVGIVAAVTAYYLTTDHVMIFGNYSYGIIAQLAGSFVVVGFFSWNKQRFDRVKLETMQTIGASIAHELRTPLGAIQSGVVALRQYLPFLLDTYASVRMQGLPVEAIRTDHLNSLPEVLDNVGFEADHASIIVEMLLTNLKYPEVNAGGFSFCSISECIKYALSHYTFLIGQKEKVQWCLIEGMDFTIYGNQLFIEHILFNLLKNALYFIDKAGKGEISIWLEKADKYNKLHFKDTGSGISRKYLPHIFDRFFTKDTHRGSGIGLAFCKTVMEAHGGSITCHSVEKEYTEFILSFPNKER